MANSSPEASQEAVAQKQGRSFTSAERIAELNEIDSSVSQLLKSAGAAVKILANQPGNTSSQNHSNTLESQQESFTAHARDYFSTLSSIEVRLRRQVYALEEAGLVQQGAERDAKRGRQISNEDSGRIGEGGGPLDESWLNARAYDKVGRGMEAQLWARASKLAAKTRSGGHGVNGQADEANSELEDKMEMDDAGSE